MKREDKLDSLFSDLVNYASVSEEITLYVKAQKTLYGLFDNLRFYHWETEHFLTETKSITKKQRKEREKIESRIMTVLVSKAYVCEDLYTFGYVSIDSEEEVLFKEDSIVRSY